MIAHNPVFFLYLAVSLTDCKWTLWVSGCSFRCEKKGRKWRINTVESVWALGFGKLGIGKRLLRCFLLLYLLKRCNFLPASTSRARWRASRDLHRDQFPGWRRLPVHTTGRKKNYQKLWEGSLTFRLRVLRPNFSVSSVTERAFGRSCLFAKTKTIASRSSSSFS